jgi:RecA-family ATPase
VSERVVKLWGASEPADDFRPYYASQMEGETLKPREWIVDSLILRKTVCLMAGPPKIGKSLALQQLLTSAAIGEPWLGHAVVQTRAFGMFAEDPDDELKRRQTDINTHFSRSPADLELELSWEAREGKEAVLVNFDRSSDKPQFTPLWHQLWTFIGYEGVGLVGLDTAAVVFGGNENYRSQVTVLMRELVKQAVRMNGAIILNSHPTKSGPAGYSGSTAWLGSARFGMSLGRPADYDEENDEPRHIRVLRGLGGNYASGFRPKRLEYRQGVFVQAEDQPASTGRVLTHTERQDLGYRLLAGLKRVIQNGGEVYADEIHRKGLASRARRSPDALINHIPLNDLYVAQRDLVQAGQVIRVAVGNRCLLRPTNGPAYPNEQPWVDDTL